MRKFLHITYALIIAFALMLVLPACGAAPSGDTSTSALASGVSSQAPAAASNASATSTTHSPASSSHGTVVESGTYSDKESVALYIHLYGHLPSNYISKTKARKGGWVNTKGNLWDVLPGMSIGGSEFYDDDEQLPYERGRRWTECDIDYDGGFRNAKRIVFSNDGLIFYTDDHYRTFEQLY